MQRVLELINQTCVSLDSEEKRQANEHIKFNIEDQLISKMKCLDPLFAKLYKGIAFGGSYYDNLKIGKPDEFDLDIKLSLMDIVCKIHNKKKCDECIKIHLSDQEGFLYFKLDSTFNSDITKEFCDQDGYVQNTKVLKSWFKRLVNKSIEELNKETSQNERLNQKVVIIFMSESGPALTLRIEDTRLYIKVDLVPAFVFPEKYKPKGFRDFSGEFLLVPKDFYKDPMLNNFRNWRASLQYQEREMILNKGKLKPSLRLLKQMRNRLEHNKISSYYLKTIVLWEIYNKSFDWNSCKVLSEGFKHLVEKYTDSLLKKEIPYFWKEENNFLEDIDERTLKNFYGEVKSKYDEIKKDESNPYAIAKLVLKEGSDDYNEIIDKMEKDDSYGTKKYKSYAKMEDTLNQIVSEHLQTEEKDIKTINSTINKEIIPKLKSYTNFGNYYAERSFIYENFSTTNNYTLCIPLSCKCKIKNCTYIYRESQKKHKCLKLKVNNCSNIFMDTCNRNNYISPTKVLNWMSDCFQSVLEKSELDINCTSLTLKIKTETNNIIYVNILPAWKFHIDDISRFTTKPNCSEKPDLFMIPNQITMNNCCEYEWWPFFVDQEKEILKNKQALNKAFKLLKKSRTTLQHITISDYMLKNILLEFIQDDKIDPNWPLSKLFMNILFLYKDTLKKEKNLYYWNTRINLYESCQISLSYYYTKLEQELNEVFEQYNTNPTIIKNFVLGEDNSSNTLRSRTSERNYFRNESSSSSETDSDENNDYGWSSRYYESDDFRPSASSSSQQALDEAGANGWVIGAAVVGTAAVLGLVGLSIWSSRNNNRR